MHLQRRLDAVATGPLGAVERLVSGDDERLEVAGGRRGGDAEARRQREPGALRCPDVPRRKPPACPLRERRAVEHVCLRQDERKLLATPPAGEVDLAGRLLEDPPELP